MRNLTIAVVLTVVTAGLVHGQGRVQFSGTWAMQGDINGARALSGLLAGICGLQCEIAQSGSTLTIKRTPTQKIPMPEVLTIEWAQSRTVPQAGTGAAPAPRVTWTSEWSGDALVITSVEASTYPVAGQPVERKTETRNTLSLENGSLKIAMTYVGAALQPGETVASTLTYRRVTDAGR